MFTLKSESKIKISLSIKYLSYFNLTQKFSNWTYSVSTVSDQDLPVAKWLERDSTWLVRVKGSSPSRVASLRGPWLESSHESQKCDSSRDSSRVTSHESTPLALIHRCFLSRCSSNLIRAYKTYVRPLVEYAPQVWSPHTKSLLGLVEGVQRSFTKRLPGLNSLTYAQRLTSLQLQSLEHRRLISDLVMTFNIIQGYTALNFDDFFSFSKNLSSRGHPFKLNFP